MNIPNEPSLSYIAFILFLVGGFFVVAGLGIVKIEKITVSPGIKTWGLGLALILSATLIFFNPRFFIKTTSFKSDNGNSNKTRNIESLATARTLKKPDLSSQNLALQQMDSQIESEVKQVEVKQKKEVVQQREQAKNSLYHYYENLNNKNINSAWAFISRNLQIKLFKSTSTSPNKNYKKWWLHEVEGVVVVSLAYLDGSPKKTRASIDAKLIYVLQGGKLCSDDHSIINLRLINNKWSMFDKNKIVQKKRRRCL